jgi:hypothetical protein
MDELYHIIFGHGVKCKKMSPTDLTCLAYDGFLQKSWTADRFMISGAHILQVV